MFTFAVMALGGMLGSVCGLLVGLVYALVASWWSRTGRAGGPIRYAWLAAAVTAVLCTAFCALMFAPDIDDMSVAELVTWWVAPTVTATAAAAVIGGAIWTRGTPPGEILA